MSAGTECSSGLHATAVSASCSLKGRPVSAEQRPAATNPGFGEGAGETTRVARILPISRKMNLASLLRLSRANSGLPGLLFAIGGLRLVATASENRLTDHQANGAMDLLTYGLRGKSKMGVRS
jgi:hypothetical protein